MEETRSAHQLHQPKQFVPKTAKETSDFIPSCLQMKSVCPLGTRFRDEARGAAAVGRSIHREQIHTIHRCCRKIYTTSLQPLLPLVCICTCFFEVKNRINSPGPGNILRPSRSARHPGHPGTAPCEHTSGGSGRLLSTAWKQPSGGLHPDPCVAPESEVRLLRQVRLVWFFTKPAWHVHRFDGS